MLPDKLWLGDDDGRPITVTIGGGVERSVVGIRFVGDTLDDKGDTRDVIGNAAITDAA
jgi:hypothetical protein